MCINLLQQFVLSSPLQCSLLNSWPGRCHHVDTSRYQEQVLSDPPPTGSSYQHDLSAIHTHTN